MRTRRRNKQNQYYYWRTNLCHACLSSDKTLYKVGKFGEYYKFICRNIELDLTLEIHLCWLCLAVLRKFKSFEEKVQNADNILKNHFDENLPPKCLSELTTYHSMDIDYETDIKTEENDNLIILLNEDEDKNVVTVFQDEKVKLEDEKIEILIEENTNPGIEIPKDEDVKEHVVKKEPTSDEEMKGADKDNTFDDDPIDEVHIYAEECSESMEEWIDHKIEPTKKQNKSHKDQRRRKYKRVIKNCSNNIMKIKAIAHDELDSWLERERSSEYFQNLKNKCELCISKVGDLAVHNKLFHKKQKSSYLCSKCQRRFKSKRRLELHIASHYHINYCGECGYQCYTRGHLKDHVEVHMKTIVCNECGAGFRNMSVFKAHYRDLHCSFVCDHCNKSFKKKSVLEGHIIRHHIPKVCHPCQLTFDTYRGYTEHNNVKHVFDRSESNFCVQCDRQFDNRALFLRHCYSNPAHARERKNYHSSAPKRAQVQCLGCPNVYKSKSHMINHYRLEHSKEYLFYCSTCEKAFLTKHKLRDHVQYFHEGKAKPKNKICKFCGRGFNTNRILTHHVRTHTGEKPYECSFCDATFAQKAARKCHEQFIHLNKKRPKNKAIANTFPSNIDEQ